MNTPLSPPLNRYIMAMRIVLIAASLALVADEIITFFFSSQPVALLIQGEVWTKPLTSFQAFDKAVLFFIVNTGNFCWLFALYQLWALCALYSDNHIFEAQNARHFINIGYALMVMSILQMFVVPTAGAYLLYRNISPQMPDINILGLLELDLLVAGLLFLLIAKIMEFAATIQEESKLTI